MPVHLEELKTSSRRADDKLIRANEELTDELTADHSKVTVQQYSPMLSKLSAKFCRKVKKQVDAS